jgi:hypothetical protein
MTSQVIVKNAVVSTGCHIDGSHQRVEDFLVAVIEKAQSYGYEVKDGQLLVCAAGDCVAGESCDWTILLEGLIEEAEHAEEWLNEVTEDGYVWHEEEQSLFLSDVFDLPDSV